MKSKAILFAFLFLLALPVPQLLAGGTRVKIGIGHAGVSRSSGGFVHHQHFHSGFGHPGLHVTIGRPPHHHGFGHHGHFHHGFGHHGHFHHELFFGPHHHFGFHGGPPIVVISSPFSCLFHGRAFVNQAGFLDHLSGAHGVSLESGLSFCNEAGSGCVFFGY
ncbi:MAG: hypothetical protein ACREQA_01915 [Candidatus Binatia bacterium]